MPNVFTFLYIIIQFPYKFAKSLQKYNIFLLYFCYFMISLQRKLTFLLHLIIILHHQKLINSKIINKKRDSCYRARTIYHYIRKEKVVRTSSRSLGLSTSIPSSG